MELRGINRPSESPSECWRWFSSWQPWLKAMPNWVICHGAITARQPVLPLRVWGCSWGSCFAASGLVVFFFGGGVGGFNHEPKLRAQRLGSTEALSHIPARFCLFGEG